MNLDCTLACRAPATTPGSSIPPAQASATTRPTPMTSIPRCFGRNHEQYSSGQSSPSNKNKVIAGVLARLMLVIAAVLLLLILMIAAVLMLLMLEKAAVFMLLMLVIAALLMLVMLVSSYIDAINASHSSYIIDAIDASNSSSGDTIDASNSSCINVLMLVSSLNDAIDAINSSYVDAIDTRNSSRIAAKKQLHLVLPSQFFWVHTFNFMVSTNFMHFLRCIHRLVGSRIV